jgi:hypothetical protein
MMIKLSKIIALLFFLPFCLSAQYNFTSGFGELKGPGGYASQSIGQIAYTTISSDSGTVKQGVIQPYQISVLSGAEREEIQLSFNVFPNPVQGELTLQIENLQTESLQYRLFDINGRLLQNSIIRDASSLISTADLIPATYFLQVLDKDKLLKIFKVVKI